MREWKEKKKDTTSTSTISTQTRQRGEDENERKKDATSNATISTLQRGENEQEKKIGQVGFEKEEAMDKRYSKEKTLAVLEEWNLQEGDSTKLFAGMMKGAYRAWDE